MERNGIALMTEEANITKEEKTQVKCIVRQSMTALGPIMSTIAAGMVSGYSGILLPQLKPISNSTDENVTSINLTDYLNMNELTVNGVDEESWIAASSALAMAPGCWLAGATMERFGRRGAFLILSPVFFAGWLIVAFAPSILWLIIGRVICGLCNGFNGPSGPVYIAETSEPSLRGILLAGISLAIAVGILFSQALGTWLHWRLAAILCGLFPVFCFIFCAIAPESPTWLVKRNKTVKARKVWVSLRGVYCDQEFSALRSRGVGKTGDIVNVENQTSESKPFQDDDNFRRNTEPQPNWKTIIVSSAFLKPLVILTVFFFVNQFAGVNAIAAYSVEMFGDVAGKKNAYTGTLILNVIRVVFSLAACWLTRNYRRRSLTIISGVGTVVSLLFLSASLYMEIGRPWLPICSLFGYMCFVSVGLVPLPWLLCGELFAASVRGLGSGFTSGMAFTFFFIVVKAAPGMMESLGAAGTFACYGIVTFAGTIFLYFYLPETKDKTLAEIEERFKNPKKQIGKK